MKHFKSKRNQVFSLIVILFILFLIDCGEKNSGKPSPSYDLSDPEKKNSIILKIQDSLYFNSDFENYLFLTVGKDYNTLSVISLSRLLDNFIEEKIFLGAAQNQNIFLTREEQKDYLAKLSRESWLDSKNPTLDEKESRTLFERLLIDKYIFEIVKDIEAAEEEIKAYYDRNKREFLRPERLKVSQILLETEENAIEILEMVKNSTEENFRKAAQDESIGIEAVNGGMMGLFEMGQLPYEMDKVVFSLKVGEVSPVVESSYGYHIFRLDEKYEPELISEEEALAEIRLKILDQKIKQFLTQHLKELKENMEWDFYSKNLSFPYQRNSHE